MPKFFMHIHDDDKFFEDPEGKIHPDVEAARVEAEEAAREMLAEKVRRGVKIDGQKIGKFDEDGRSVAMVKFRDQPKLRDESED